MSKVGNLRVIAIIGAVCATIAVAGCGDVERSTVRGTLDRLEPLTESCQGPLNGYAGIDLSASGREGSGLPEERMEALRGLADQVAACGGHVKVVGFSSRAAETYTLGEADLPTDFGTETARLIRADKEESALIGDVEDELPIAMQELNPNGTDVLAQLTLADQYQQQRREGELYVHLETDGIATTKPVEMNTPEFDLEAARTAAAQVKLPDLSGATVRLSGIAKTTGERRLASERAAAITAFFTIACRRTHADCLVTTDYTPGG
jgi:hypothetical protein